MFNNTNGRTRTRTRTPLCAMKGKVFGVLAAGRRRREIIHGCIFHTHIPYLQMQRQPVPGQPSLSQERPYGQAVIPALP